MQSNRVDIFCVSDTEIHHGRVTLIPIGLVFHLNTVILFIVKYS